MRLGKLKEKYRIATLSLYVIKTMPHLDANTMAMLAIAIAAASEIIGMSSLRANSVVQLLLQFLRIAFPKR